LIVAIVIAITAALVFFSQACNTCKSERCDECPVKIEVIEAPPENITVMPPVPSINLIRGEFEMSVVHSSSDSPLSRSRVLRGRTGFYGFWETINP
jgi:hypothetical protein